MSSQVIVNNKFKKWAIRIMAALAVIIFILFTSAYLIFRSAKVQTWLTQKITKEVSSRLNTHFSIRGVDIDIFSSIILEEVYLEDQQKDTVLYAEKLKINIGLLALRNKRLVIDLAGLYNARSKLYTLENDTVYNYQFIIDSLTNNDDPLADTTSKQPSAWTFDLKKVELESINFSMSNAIDQSDLQLRLNSLFIKINSLDLKTKLLQIETIALDGIRFSQHTPYDTISISAEPLDSLVLNPSGFTIVVNSLLVQNSSVHLIKQHAPESLSKFDVNHLELELNKLAVSTIVYSSEQVSLNLESLQLLEANSGFSVNDLNVQTAISGNQLSAELHAFSTSISRFKGLAHLKINDLLAENVLEQLTLDLATDQFQIGLNDLRYFSNALDSLPHVAKQIINFATELSFSKAQLNLTTLDLSGNGFELNTRGVINQPLAWPNSVADLEVNKLLISPTFYKEWLGDEASDQLIKLGQISAQFKLLGDQELADFTGSIKSNLGLINTQLRIKDQLGKLHVKGNVHSDQVALQTVLDSVAIDQLSFKLNIDAKWAEHHLGIDTFLLHLPTMRLNGYSYKNLFVNVSLHDSLLKLNSNYKDPNLDYQLLSTINLHSDNFSITAEADINKIDLLQLSLSTDSLLFSTHLSLQSKNKELEFIQGTLQLLNTKIINGEDNYVMDSLWLSVGIVSNQKLIQFRTDFMNLSANGNFQFQTLPAALKQSYWYYRNPDSLDTAATLSAQNITINANVWETPDILNSIVDLHLDQSISFTANYQSQSHQVNFDLSVPDLHYQEFEIKNLIVAANSNPQRILLNADLQRLTKEESFQIQNLSIVSSLKQQLLELDLKLGKADSAYSFELKTITGLHADTVLVDINDLRLKLNSQVWKFQNKALVKYAPDYFWIENFHLQNQQQLLSLHSTELDSVAILNVTIQEFSIPELLKLAGVYDYGIEGELQIKAEVHNVLKPQRINFSAAINPLVLDDKNIGSLSLEARQASGQEWVHTEFKIVGPDNDIAITGKYNLFDESNNLDFRIQATKIATSQWSGLLDQYVSLLEGEFKADIVLKGSTQAPQASGFMAFSDGFVVVPIAIGTPLKLSNQEINITNDRLTFTNFTVLDSANNAANINGFIEHQAFQNFKVNLRFQTNRFKFYGASARVNPAFYGRLWAGTRLDINGPINNLDIKGNFETLRGTDLVVALLDEAPEVSQAEYINFTRPNAYLQVSSISDSVISIKPNVNTKAIEGINMALTFKMRKDSKLSIIIDPVNKDRLEVQGNADFRIDLRSNGDLAIQGTYFVDQGFYRLSFLDVIKKQFDIRSGSTITFAGDPAIAQLNITTAYTTETSRDPLVLDMIESMPANELRLAREKRPVSVLLNIKGALNEPEISFDLEIPEAESSSSIVYQRLQSIKADPTQLYQQVFALIVLNRFMPVQGSLLASSGSGSLAGSVNNRIDASVSQLMTQQLNRLTDDYLGGVELELNVESNPNTTDDAANRDVQLKLSKGLFNDRVQVKVGGTTNVNQADGNSGQLYGEFEVVYKINPAGNLNIRIFRTNQRDVFTNEMVDRSGVSLRHSKSFSTLKGFIRKEEEVILH